MEGRGGVGRGEAGHEYPQTHVHGALGLMVSAALQSGRLSAR